MAQRDVPLFTFEVVIEYVDGYFWLTEYCVYWNSVRVIVETVKIGENLDGYQEASK